MTRDETLMTSQRKFLLVILCQAVAVTRLPHLSQQKQHITSRLGHLSQQTQHTLSLSVTSHNRRNTVSRLSHLSQQTHHVTCHFHHNRCPTQLLIFVFYITSRKQTHYSVSHRHYLSTLTDGPTVSVSVECGFAPTASVSAGYGFAPTVLCQCWVW